MVNAKAGGPIRIFVHLGYGFGASGWRERWQRGAIPGLNERLPYGYFHAAGPDCTVEYSEDRRESPPTRLLRRVLRRLAGFDLPHAWYNRRGIRGADAIWTHEEIECLAVLLYLRRIPRARRPSIIAQCVWLFDRWASFSAPRRWLYRSLLQQADVISVKSSDNLAIARLLFPGVRCELMLYGNDISMMKAPVRRPANNPLRLLALGNDMHRDWPTLIAAVAPLLECELTIGSAQVDPRIAADLKHIRVARPVSAAEILALYAWADIAIVPLKPNVHASGITAIAEAVLSGVPIVCTGTAGGLRGYYPDDAVSYVPPGDPAAMGRAITTLGADDGLRFQMATRAQHRMREAGLSSRDRALRMRDMTRGLLEQRAATGNFAANHQVANDSMRTTG